jgi:hypothetical protein
MDTPTNDQLLCTVSGLVVWLSYSHLRLQFCCNTVYALHIQCYMYISRGPVSPGYMQQIVPYLVQLFNVSLHFNHPVHPPPSSVQSTCSRSCLIVLNHVITATQLNCTQLTASKLSTFIFSACGIELSSVANILFFSIFMTYLLPVELCDKSLHLRNFEILRARINQNGT